jgi:prenyltransferase beta subunit
MRWFVLPLLVLALIALGVRAQAPEKAAGATKEQRDRAVAAGLKCLSQQQQAGGSFGITPKQPHAGITGMAGLAFLCSGSTPDQGPYKQNIRNAAEFIIGRQQGTGILGGAGEAAPMYGHPFALTFLCQCYSMTEDQELRDALRPAIKLAVMLIEDSQNKEGGWRYQPAPVDADVCVSSGQLTALCAARKAGFEVNEKTMGRAIAYVKSCRNLDGGFRYMAGVASSGWARSSAALAALMHAGSADKDLIASAGAYLAKVTRPGDVTACDHFYYGNYYRVQASVRDKAALSDEHYDALAAELVGRQDAKTGKWSGDISEDYATSMALMLLQLRDSKLPLLGAK